VGGLPTSAVRSFAVHPTNPKVMYVAMRDGLFRSDDAGQTWTRADSPSVVAIAASPKRPTEVHAVTLDGTMWTSTDGGLRWQVAR
jgi:hypothetical protein